jgi:glyoxylase-like metal-dependent hydrolase (beta-lactamase superfamily II)
VVLHELTGGHTHGDQIIFLPHEQVLFTGDLVENHSFPILSDQDASANRWIEELTSLMHFSPATVVPGHGELGTVELMQEVRDLLIFVREEVNRRIKGDRRLRSSTRKLPGVSKSVTKIGGTICGFLLKSETSTQS